MPFALRGRDREPWPHFESHKITEDPALSVAQALMRLHNGFVTAERLRATSDRLRSGQKRAKPTRE